MPDKSENTTKIKCSFCGKEQEQVRRIVAGPGVCICDECIELCQEIIEEDFSVVVRDSNGIEVFNEEVTSLRNGFFEIWLPRNIEGTILVNYNGLSSETTISTYSGDLTCLTSMELT